MYSFAMARHKSRTQRRWGSKKLSRRRRLNLGAAWMHVSSQHSVPRVPCVPCVPRSPEMEAALAAVRARPTGILLAVSILSTLQQLQQQETAGKAARLMSLLQ